MSKNTNVKRKLKRIIEFITNPHLLLCLGIAWLITNGWAYILFAVGTYLRSDRIIAVSGAYIAFLWLPFSPEKLLTLAIAVFLLRLMFPDDKKTLGVLRLLSDKLRLKRKNKDK